MQCVGPWQMLETAWMTQTLRPRPPMQPSCACLRSWPGSRRCSGLQEVGCCVCYLAGMWVVEVVGGGGGLCPGEGEGGMQPGVA